MTHITPRRPRTTYPLVKTEFCGEDERVELVGGLGTGLHRRAAVVVAIRELARDRTAVVFAQRPFTTADADLIALLQDGRVIKWGPHRDLLARDGRNATMWMEMAKAGGRQIQSST